MAIKKIEYNNNNFLINYEIVNNDKENIIIFLHGWGSNKEIMKQAFSKKLRDFKHIYIDMPGFGRSLNDVVLTTQDYANIMEMFNQSLNIKSSQTTILGHSFGGKVATLLNPKNLVLCSSAGIIEPKPLSVKLKIMMAKIFNIFGLGKLTKMFRSADVDKMSQNMYETFKNVVDEDFQEQFKSFENNTLIFWGDQDYSTSLESGQTINKLIANSFFKSYDGDHYFFIKNSDDICDIIKNNIK